MSATKGCGEPGFDGIVLQRRDRGAECTTIDRQLAPLAALIAATMSHTELPGGRIAAC